MMKRVLLTLAGVLLTMLGIVGLFLPILPGIVFLLAAAVCFSSVSPPVNRWLSRQPRLARWRRAWHSGASLPW